MKTKGRRQSTNIEDRSREVFTPEEGEVMYPTGEIYHKPKDSNIHDKKEIEVAKELGKHNRNKTTPIPTPRPLNIVKTQVTPGKWTTK